MPINPNLLLGGTQLQMPQQDPNAGMNALVRAMQIKDMQSNQQLNALKMQETQRGLERRNKMLGLLEQQYDKPEAREEALLRGGFVEEAAKLTKNRVDAAKVQADTDKNSVDAAHKRVNAWGQTMGFVRQNPTPENAVAAVQHLVTMGVIPAQQAQAALAQVQANPTPQNIAQFAEMGFRAALDAKEQLSKFQTNNIGGQTVTQGIDPVTGKASLVSAVQNTQSPDAVLSAETQRRGQNMTDARAREGNNIQREAARTQVIETPQGVMLVDKGTGQARPATMGGQPLPGKPSAATEKELVGIRQQNAIIDGAIAAVEKTPKAFSFARGSATMAGAIPESLAGRMDTDAERQARSYVFNNVSKVINERAGAAQSAQELARLRSFLPAETDNAEQIKSKLQAFKTYLGDMEAGTKGTKGSGATGGWSIQKVK